jgi:hypothetical protein
MASYVFGSGSLWAVRTDLSGVATPHKFGVLQDVSIDLAYTVKQLFGLYQFPVDVARGTAKISCKAKMGGIQGLLFADLFFNNTVSSGQSAVADSEAQTVTTGTASPTFKSTWTQDYGVIYNATGVPLTRVNGGAEVAGTSYSIDGSNVYHFASGDNALVVNLSYGYTIAGTGQQMTITNQTLGTAPTFQVALRQIGKTKVGTLVLFAAIASKLTLPTKLEDYTIFELDFEVFANSANNIGTWSMNEVN